MSSRAADENRAGRRLRILYLIRSLGAGGAERQLVALVSRLDRRRFAPAVALFYDQGPLRRDLAAAGDVARHVLGKRGRWDLAGFLGRLSGLIRRERPDVLHCYLTDANVLGLIGGRLGRCPRIVFGVRSSRMENPDRDLGVMISQRLSRVLAGRADLVIYNSRTALEESSGGGLLAHRGVFIPNGIDTLRFQPDDAGRRAVRAELGLAGDDLVVGQIARDAPKKDWPTFFRAAALLAARWPAVKFVGVGPGVEAANRRLRALVQANGLAGRTLLLGGRRDVDRLMPALDLIGLSSAYGEGFPNVVGEAMACGVPAVVTRVGDGPRIVGSTGLSVPPRSPTDLAAAWAALLDQGAEVRRRLGIAARRRIETLFSVESMVHRTEVAYEALARRRPID
ncbi:MAG: glycosyltransferase [Proteobacteria bacterium]|nr:glycosyltransferase [Pseudomonadota bacterium]